MRNRAFKWLSHACRIVLGVTFIFSGFVKTVDPWGTAIKIQEYLSIYGLESLSGLRFGFSIWLCGAELMMGCMLLFKVRIRLISIFALASMLFFSLAMGLGIYCYAHLPLIDFRPFKVGVNIYEAMNAYSADPGPQAGKTVLIYRDRQTGRLHEFSLDDTEWQDAGRWEWVDTRTEELDEPKVDPTLSEFSLRDAEGDATESLLTRPGRVYMLCITDSEGLDAPCERRFRGVVERAAAEGALAVCLTPERLRGVTYRSFAGSAAVRCYNIDATTLKTMLRAFNGMVVLDDGTIVEKRNCRDIR